MTKRDKILSMSDHELLSYCGGDARRWAEAFCLKVPGAPDVDLMLGWFANAIETAHDKRTGEDATAPPEDYAINSPVLDALDRALAGKRAAVMLAYADGAEIEARSQCLDGSIWLGKEAAPVWNWESFDYRVKRVEPDYIDWSHVAPGWKFMARDEAGQTYIYKSRPAIDDELSWFSPDSFSRCDGRFTSYRKGTADWKDSLVERPEGE